MGQGAMKLLTKQLLKEGPGFVKMVPEEGELALSFLIMAPCSMIIGVGPAYCGHWASREPGELCFICWSAAGGGAGPCRDGAREGELFMFRLVQTLVLVCYIFVPHVVPAEPACACRRGSVAAWDAAAGQCTSRGAPRQAG